MSEATRPHSANSVERPTARLVFLCGVASGGTDLLQNVVNGHPDVFIPGEFPFLAAAAERFPDGVPSDQLDELIAELRRLDEYNTFVHHHFSNFMANRRDPVTLGPAPPPGPDGLVRVSDVYQWLLGVPSGIAWTGNKTPTNTENMDKLHRLFPDARYIVIVRDARDVALSWRRKWGKDDLLAAAKWERRLARGRALAEQLPPGRVLFLRFEQLLDDLEATCREICAFLELEYTPEMLRFHERVHKQIDGKPNWGKPLVAGNYGKWRTTYTPRRARRIEELAYRGLATHGYAIQYAKGPRPLRRIEKVIGITRDLHGLIFVGNRYQTKHRFRERARQVGLEFRKLFLRRSIRY